MNESFAYYSSGQYTQALDELNRLDANRFGSLEEVSVLENNKCICRVLKAVCEAENTSLLDGLLLQNYEKCIAVGLPNELISLQLELIASYNFNWWLLATRMQQDINVASWANAIEMAANLHRRVLGEGVSISRCIERDTIEEILRHLPSLKDQIIIRHQSVLNIFLEYLLSLLLIFLKIFNEPELQERITFLLQSVLRDKREILAVSSKRKESTVDTIIFKFGLSRINSTVNDMNIEESLHFLYILYLAISPESKHTVEVSWPMNPLGRYVDAFKLFKSGNFEKALTPLLGEIHNADSAQLKARYHCLLGQIYSALGERQKAVENYIEAKEAQRNVAVFHYYLAMEYGKMGLHDVMLSSYERALKALKVSSNQGLPFPIEAKILSVIHGHCEISRSEVIYLLAVAYGLCERFEDSTLAFEKLITSSHYSTIIAYQQQNTDRIAKIPRAIVILHEAATMNILTGNLPRSEELCRDAINMYPNQAIGEDNKMADAHGTKDSNWLRILFERELNLNVSTEKEVVRYHEEYVSFFDEDVIGLLLLAETQRIQQIEDERITLNQALILLSKHIARMQKESNTSREEGVWLVLVKALTAKTCLHLARMQAGKKSFADVDRMFKRALSCNHGDKDIIFYYATFLDKSDKHDDASKLWKTFYDKENIIVLDDCQSLALRHLLRSQISQRQLQSLAVTLGVYS